jgi:hypothetical protein
MQGWRHRTGSLQTLLLLLRKLRPPLLKPPLKKPLKPEAAPHVRG